MLNAGSPSRSQRSPLPVALVAPLQSLIVTLLPVFLVLTSVRLVTTETFARFEYNRPGFPDDPYGFTQDDRREYAPYALEYLLSDKDINYLADLQLDGQPMYTAKELRHMEDVKVVMRVAFLLRWIVSMLLSGVVLALARHPDTRAALRRGLLRCGIYTILLVVLLVVFVLASWDLFFESFHNVFFAGDSWLFSNRTTLIRLFPEQFWFDAAITIGLLTVTGALLAILVAWGWGHWARRHTGPPPDDSSVESETTPIPDSLD